MEFVNLYFFMKLASPAIMIVVFLMVWGSITIYENLRSRFR